MPPHILPIVKNPAKVLRARAKEIRPDDIASPKIQRLIEKMKAALAATPDGVGLAAPQVGESLRLFIVSGEAEEIDKAGKKRRSAEERATSHEGTAYEGGKKPYEDRAWTYNVYINPTVQKKSSKKLSDVEGCLSVPEKFGAVRRSEKITITARGADGKKITQSATRFVARVIQHELDHLDGALFLDKTDQLLDTT